MRDREGSLKNGIREIGQHLADRLERNAVCNVVCGNAGEELAVADTQRVAGSVSGERGDGQRGMCVRTDTVEQVGTHRVGCDQPFPWPVGGEQAEVLRTFAEMLTESTG